MIAFFRAYVVTIKKVLIGIQCNFLVKSDSRIIPVTDLKKMLYPWKRHKVVSM